MAAGRADVRRVARRALAILALALTPIGAGAPGAGAPEHAVLASHTGSRGQTERLVNRAALQILLEHDYQETGRSDAAWKTGGFPGLTDSRYFLRTLPDGTRRLLELVSLLGASGDAEIHLYGKELAGAGVRANPDVAAIAEEFRVITAGDAAAKSVSAEKKVRALGHRFVHLSYTQSDRVLATLKALGYSTVEFRALPGESVTEKLYDPAFASNSHYPLVIKLLDPPKTSLLDRDPADLGPVGTKGAGAAAEAKRTAVPDIGGTYLHQTTAGEPLERLLIVYDEDDPEPTERLLNLIKEEIDVRARQVVISALVVEINTNRFHDLGLSFSGGNGRTDISFGQTDATTGSILPFTFTFDKGVPKTSFTFTAQLQALVEKGEAEVLSNPSVLVLDGRQARIQIGQQVPVVNSTSTAAGITSSVDYFPVGIVLNLRPRVSDEGDEVTMQVETIVSALASGSSGASSSPSVLVAPTIDNRQVQSFVRVADNTPFIIGGLISSDSKDARSGIPGLSRIPLIGRLFRRRTTSGQKREVIVVLTPHVVPLDDRSFSYVIPRDSATFDSSGHVLFRDAYRIRSTDLYDFSFVYGSETLRSLVGRLRERDRIQPGLHRTEPYASVLRGEVPGEDILVRRMLWDIVRKTGIGRSIDPGRMLLFETEGGAQGRLQVTFLDKKLAAIGPEKNALLLTFPASTAGTPEHPFVQPAASVRYDTITKKDFSRRLSEANRRGDDGLPREWSVLISEEFTGSSSPLDILRGVLVLKKILALNGSLPLTIRDFSVGRQIIMPTEDDIEKTVHVIDRDTAKLFYEVKEYKDAFEQEFNSRTRRIGALLETPPPPVPVSAAPPAARQPAPLPAKVEEARPESRQTPRQRLDRMAAESARQYGKAKYSLQVELACRTETAERALEEGGDKIWLLPASVKGSPCYRLLWDRFASREEAQAAAASLPAIFRKSGEPFVIRLEALPKN